MYAGLAEPGTRKGYSHFADPQGCLLDDRVGRGVLEFELGFGAVAQGHDRLLGKDHCHLDRVAAIGRRRAAHLDPVEHDPRRIVPLVVPVDREPGIGHDGDRGIAFLTGIERVGTLPGDKPAGDAVELAEEALDFGLELVRFELVRRRIGRRRSSDSPPLVEAIGTFSPRPRVL